MIKVEHVRASSASRPAGIEVDLTAALLLAVGGLLLAHSVLLSGGEAWGAVLVSAVLLSTGAGLLRRHCWARRAALWLFVLAVASSVAGMWRLNDLLDGLDALRGVAHAQGRDEASGSLVLSTDEALMLALAYWGLGWCAWRLLSRVTSREFAAQTELRRLRKVRQAQRKSPST